MTRRVSTVGVLHCGELGSSMAQVLLADGVRVVTTCAGRSSDTFDRAEAAGVEIVDDYADLVHAADVVLSMVPPAAARSVATRCAGVPGDGVIYVDVNSINPTEAEDIRSVIEASGFSYVSASIQGSATRLQDMGVAYLSGPAAADVLPLFDGLARTETLGVDIGLAKSMKLLLSGASKGLSMLYVELAVLAQRLELEDRFGAELSAFYPAITDLVERTLPTYPRHVDRRIDEVRAIAELADDVDAGHAFIDATRFLLETGGRAWSGLPADPTLDDVIAAVTFSTERDRDQRGRT